MLSYAEQNFKSPVGIYLFCIYSFNVKHEWKNPISQYGKTEISGRRSGFLAVFPEGKLVSSAAFPILPLDWHTHKYTLLDFILFIVNECKKWKEWKNVFIDPSVLVRLPEKQVN